MLSTIKTLGRVLQTIVMLPFAIVVALPVVGFCVSIFAWQIPQWIWSAYKWKALLAQQGRFRNRKIVISELRTGTLIVDSPTLGWGLLRCWWTPDELRTLTPHKIPSEDDRQRHFDGDPEQLEMPFDRWVHTYYLDDHNGSAILLSARRGDRFAEKHVKLNPKLDVVQTWSGPVIWANSLERACVKV